MVKFVVLLCTLSTSILVNAQVDTSKCEESFARFSALFADKLIFLWEAAPSLKESSQKDIETLDKYVKEQTNYEYIIVNMIIDPAGTPICFKFYQEIEPEIKEKFLSKLKLLRFNPALVRGKGVESYYLIKSPHSAKISTSTDFSTYE